MKRLIAIVLVFWFFNFAAWCQAYDVVITATNVHGSATDTIQITLAPSPVPVIEFIEIGDLDSVTVNVQFTLPTDQNSVPDIANFVFRVNGSAVGYGLSNFAYSIQNILFDVATPVIPSDTLTLDYTEGSNGIRGPFSRVDIPYTGSFFGTGLTYSADTVGGTGLPVGLTFNATTLTFTWTGGVINDLPSFSGAVVQNNVNPVVAFPASGNAGVAQGAGGIDNRGAYELFWANGQQVGDLPKIKLVDNLNSTGASSLDEAFDGTDEPRIIIPRVSGWITTTAGISSTYDYVTVAGQTSPEGIGVVQTGTNNAMIYRGNYGVFRFFKASSPGAGSNDGFSISSSSKATRKNIADHISVFWCEDEQMSIESVTGGGNQIQEVTLQWNLNFEGNPTQNFGTLTLGGGTSLNNADSSNNISFLHNFWAHHNDRHPAMGEMLDGIEFIGNVIYNWDYRGTYMRLSNRRVNWIGNHSKSGPDSSGDRFYGLAQGANAVQWIWYTNQLYLKGNFATGIRDTDLENDATEMDIFVDTNSYFGIDESVYPDEDTGLTQQVPPTTNASGEAEEGYRRGSWSGVDWGSGTFTLTLSPWNLGWGTEYTFDRAQNVLDVLDYAGDYLHYTTIETAMKTEFNAGTGEVPTSDHTYPGDYPSISNPAYPTNSWGIHDSWLTANGYLTGQSENYYVDPANASHAWGGIVQEFIDDIAYFENPESTEAIANLNMSGNDQWEKDAIAWAVDTLVLAGEYAKADYITKFGTGTKDNVRNWKDGTLVTELSSPVWLQGQGYVFDPSNPAAVDLNYQPATAREENAMYIYKGRYFSNDTNENWLWGSEEAGDNQLGFKLETTSGNYVTYVGDGPVGEFITGVDSTSIITGARFANDSIATFHNDTLWQKRVKGFIGIPPYDIYIGAKDSINTITQVSASRAEWFITGDTTLNLAVWQRVLHRTDSVYYANTITGDVTPPTTPTIAFDVAQDNSLSFDITVASTDASGNDHYEVEVDQTFDKNINGGATDFTVTGLSASTSYDVRIRGVDPSNNKSNYSNEVTQSTSAPSGGLVITESFTGTGMGDAADVSSYWVREGSDVFVEGGSSGSLKIETINGVLRANKFRPDMIVTDTFKTYPVPNKREEWRSTGGDPPAAGEPPDRPLLKEKYYMKYRWRVTSNHTWDNSGSTVITGQMHAPEWAASGGIHQSFRIDDDDLTLKLSYLWSNSEANPDISGAVKTEQTVITTIVKDTWYYIVRDFRYNPDPGDTGADQAEHFLYISTGGWPDTGDIVWDYNSGNNKGLGFKHLAEPDKQTSYVKIPGVYAWRWGTSLGVKLSSDDCGSCVYEVEIDDFEYGEGWDITP